MGDLSAAGAGSDTGCRLLESRYGWLYIGGVRWLGNVMCVRRLAAQFERGYYHQFTNALMTTLGNYY